MLQQTQVERVNDKYQEFIASFPDFAALSQADLREVLQVWQGLGYNKRALSLVKLAKEVVTEYGGELQSDTEILSSLPGVGKATAGSLVAFAFNLPAVFVETNIRRVFIHFFFQDSEGVHDREILRLVEQTLDRTNPREWYYALMDYGAMLKRGGSNPNRRSVHYKKQSPFENSDRKIRGEILRILLEKKSLSAKKIAGTVKENVERVCRILSRMRSEGLVQQKRGSYSIP